MDVDEEEAGTRDMVSLKRSSESCEELVLTELCPGNLDSGHDLELICDDGVVLSYQTIFANNSKYLNSLLSRFHCVEFSVGDWNYGEMFLLDRRKSSDVVSLSLPGTQKKILKLFIQLVSTGSVSLESSISAKSFKELWKTLKIDSVKLDSLEVIPEVDLINKSTKIGGKKLQTAKNYLPELQDIKKEIMEENEEFQEFTNSLEVECKFCKESFPSIDELLRHMEFTHQATKSMFDEIKYRKSKDSGDEKHPKGKGKGKGKKSFMTKPVRKENFTQDDERSMSLSPTVVDESQTDTQIPEPLLAESDNDIHISEQEITFKDSSKESSPEGNEDQTLSNKRSIDEDNNANTSEEEPQTKKAKFDSESCSSEEAEAGEEEDMLWDDIACLYCDQNIPIVKHKPGQNKKKYQVHLLTHFNQTQYSEIPEDLRIYQCGYENCVYASAVRNTYIQHIAFKHDEWFKRINKRIIEAIDNPKIAEELEDLSGVKEAFVTDYRIIVKGPNVKPLWVDGISLGREKEPDLENNCSNEKEIVLESRGHEAQKTEMEEDQQDKKPKDTPYLQCHLCPKIMKTDAVNIIKNRNSYQIHLVESHFENSMYSELSDQSLYKCTYNDCTFPSTDAKSRLRIHLALSHREFYPRLFKRLDKLKSLSHKEKKLKEAKKLQDIVDFFKSDVRVIDENVPDPEAPGLSETSHECVKIKEEKEPPNVVTIDEEFSTFLKNDQIKSEPTVTEVENKGTIPDDNERTEEKSNPNLNALQSKVAKKKKKKKLSDLKAKTLRKVPAEGKKAEVDGPDKKNSTDSSEEAKEPEDDIRLHEEIVGSHETQILDNNKADVGEEKIRQEDKCTRENLDEDVLSDDEQFVPVLEYGCRQCKTEFVKRPDVIMHIITEHLVDRFGNIPDMLDNKFSCPHERCEYSASKKNSLLAHLTLKHSAVKINEVTDLIAHNEDFESPAPVVESVNADNNTLSQSNEKSDELPKEVDIKKENVEVSLGRIEITDDDAAVESWKCKLCVTGQHTTKESIKQHIILNHLQERFESLAPSNVKIFSCDQCSRYSTVSRASFIKHLGLIHQVISEEELSQHIEENKTLLLELDVIKCKCGKKFDKELHLRDHILFNHFKQKFSHIQKGLSSYNCSVDKCQFINGSRISLIKHLIDVHLAVTEAEFKKFMVSNDGPEEDEDEDEEVIPLDSDSVDDGIGFNDSVSHAAIPQSSKEDELAIIDVENEINFDGVPFENNSSHNCPVCYKLVAQRSNFEDHLQTHGIHSNPVFQCVTCNFASSFAQLYCHMSACHKSSHFIIKCLCCNLKFDCSDSQHGVQMLKKHCINREQKKIHMVKSSEYCQDLHNHHTKFRYTCQSCDMHFEYSADLENHGKVFNSRCSQTNHGIQPEPVYMCQLCNVTKTSSTFHPHLKGTQHQHNVQTEAANNKAKYGRSHKQPYYLCPTCNISSSLDNMLGHCQTQSGCSNLLCVPCGVEIHPDQHNSHCLSESHVKQTAQFSNSAELARHLGDFKYGCDSCSFLFSNFRKMSKHTNCPMLKFRCNKCDLSFSPDNFQMHLSSPLHTGKQASINETTSQPVDDSVVEVCPSEPSIMEIETIQKQPLRDSIRTRPRPPISVAGKSGVRDTVQRPGLVSQPSTIVGQNQSQLSTANKKFIFACKSCQKVFSDPAKIQIHADRDDKTHPGVPKKMICLVCPWNITDSKVSRQVSEHLASIQHKLNVENRVNVLNY